MGETSFVYLASPYTHPDTNVRHERFVAVCKKAAQMMRDGRVVFSPIAHSHPIEVLGFDQPQSGVFWKAQDAPYLHLCSELVVLMLEGWDRSPGVAHEIEVAIQRGIPVTYERPD